MKKVKKTSILIIIMVFSILSSGIVGEAGLIDDKQKESKLLQPSSDNILQTQLFDAVITFYVWEGDGCACEPIEGVSFFAVGGEGNDSGFSDEDGKCELTMVINSEYRVYIEAEKFQRIIFDVEVIGDQIFHFHMKESKSNQEIYQSFLYIFISKLINNLIR